MQVSASNDKFQIQLELPGFAPEDFSLKTKDDVIIVEAVHEAKNEDGSTDSRRFSKEFKMPGGVASEKLASTYSGAGILTVSAPRAIQAPEGAQVTYKVDFSHLGIFHTCSHHAEKRYTVESKTDKYW